MQKNPDTQSSSTSLATWIFAIHRTLSERGFDADEIISRSGLNFKELNSTTQRVPKDQLNKIWQEAERETGDDAFCISTFPHLNDPYLNALITSAQSSCSVQQAIQLLLRYYPLVTSSSKLEVKINTDIELHILPITHREPVSPQDVDLVFGLIAKYGSVLPIKEIRPSAVYLARPKPINIDAYASHFECPIQFDAEFNELHFPIQVLNENIPSANPVLANHVEQYLAEQSNLSQEDNVINNTKQAIKQLLNQGTPKLKDVALLLNTSERTLQRKLSLNQLAFTSLLHEVRLTYAKELLDNSNEPIQNISYRLGFSEPSNFIRFFKDKTGQTPKDYLKKPL